MFFLRLATPLRGFFLCVCFFVFFCRYFCRASVQFGIADGLSGVPAARGEAFFPELLVS